MYTSTSVCEAKSLRGTLILSEGEMKYLTVLGNVAFPRALQPMDHVYSPSIARGTAAQVEGCGVAIHVDHQMYFSSSFSMGENSRHSLSSDGRRKISVARNTHRQTQLRHTMTGRRLIKG